MTKELVELAVRVRTALTANKDALFAQSGALLISDREDCVVTPSIKASLTSLRASTTFDALHAWLCTAISDAARCSDAIGVETIWSTVYVYRRLLSSMPAGAVDCLACVAGLSRALRVCLPDVTPTLPTELAMDMPVCGPLLASAEVLAAISESNPLLRWRDSGCGLPSWMAPCTWPEHTPYVVFLSRCAVGLRYVLPVGPADPAVVLWHAVCFEAVSAALWCIKQCPLNDTPTPTPGEALASIVDTALSCYLCHASLPWRHVAVADAAAQLFALLPLDCLCGRAVDVLLACRRGGKEVPKTGQAAFLAACLLLVRDSVRYPHFTPEVVGHCFPVLLPLVDDYRPYFCWAGVSNLRHLLTSTLPTHLQAHTGLLMDVFRRATAATDPVVLNVTTQAHIQALHVCWGAAPCEEYDKCFEELVRRFAMQSRVEFQVVLFAGIASLSSRLHVHMARHLTSALELCKAAISGGYHAAVTLSALHVLHELILCCWPVFQSSKALREDVLAVCDSKAIIAKFEGLTVPAEALELTATAADTLTRLLSSLACIS